MGVADPQEIEDALPECLITDWQIYFTSKETRFDKLEYYLVQLSALIGSIVGVKSDNLIWQRSGDGEWRGQAAPTGIPPERRKRQRRAEKSTAAAAATTAAESKPRPDGTITEKEAEILLRVAFGV